MAEFAISPIRGPGGNIIRESLHFRELLLEPPIHCPAMKNEVPPTFYPKRFHPERQIPFPAVLMHKVIAVLEFFPAWAPHQVLQEQYCYINCLSMIRRFSPARMVFQPRRGAHQTWTEERSHYRRPRQLHPQYPRSS